MGGKLLPAIAGVILSAVVGHSAQAACSLGRLAELPVTMRGLQPTVPAIVNGVPARFVADSGAFFSSVTRAAATRLKLKVDSLPFGFEVRGADGSVRPDRGVAKSFKVEKIEFGTTDFLVVGTDYGEVDGLLGQNILGLGDAEYDLSNGVIRIFRSDGCANANLAYWAAGKQVSVMSIAGTSPADPHILGEVQINGQRVRAMFDTGAMRSGLDWASAQRLGIDVNHDEVRSGGVAYGVAERGRESWVVPIESFALADEIVKNTKIRVAKLSIPNADMLLGADFFLSHRVYISRRFRKIYFTYNGGPIFRLDDGSTTVVANVAPAKSEPAAEARPDAGALSRRAVASMTRGDHAKAIQDFNEAIKLQPEESRNYFDRSRAYFATGKHQLAIADLDRAIELKPDFADALMLRGFRALSLGQDAAAERDFEAALRARNDDFSMALAVASAYGDARRYETAVGRMDKLIERQPKAPGLSEALNARCWTRTIWGRDLDKALADCNAAIRLKPQLSSYFDSRGLTRLRRGEFEAAIADYNVSLKLQPKQAWSLYGRGLARVKSGQAEIGKQDLQAALLIEPSLAEKSKALGLTESEIVVAVR